MSTMELSATFSLAGIFGVRMLGLFMILPVFSIHATGYHGYSEALAGLAIGIYGLTQAAFQIPLGMLSDRYGRRRIILGGLLVFAAGSALAASADSMLTVILGRALQGAGAIAAAVLALAADLTREEHRTKSMAIIGISIGLSFALAIVLGPAVTAAFGMPSVFWLTAVLALVAIAVLQLAVPDPERRSDHRPAPALDQVAAVLADRQLLRLNLGIALLHVVMTSLFVALPIALRDASGLEPARHWQMYAVVLPLSVLLMAPLVRRADRPAARRPTMLGSIAALGAAILGFVVWPGNLLWMGACLVVYFAAFNVLEAALPAQVSKAAPARRKGTALGVYSTCQYLGVFTGGLLGGTVLGLGGTTAVFSTALAAAALWLAVALTQPTTPD
jgi:predicted MFS family arabinose efflux permease